MNKVYFPFCNLQATRISSYKQAVIGSSHFNWYDSKVPMEIFIFTEGTVAWKQIGQSGTNGKMEGSDGVFSFVCLSIQNHRLRLSSYGCATPVSLKPMHSLPFYAILHPTGHKIFFSLLQIRCNLTKLICIKKKGMQGKDICLIISPQCTIYHIFLEGH